jgi:hypothetical protein
MPVVHLHLDANVLIVLVARGLSTLRLLSRCCPVETPPLDALLEIVESLSQVLLAFFLGIDFCLLLIHALV